MRWPWQKRDDPPGERRDSGGAFADAVVRMIEAQAAGSAADASSTAAVEAVSGALSRALAGATVEGPEWAAETVNASVRAQIGRDLVRKGQSLHVIRLDRAGRVRLVPAASWHWEGSHDPADWTVRATAYGPSTSTTWHLPAAAVVFVAWGATAGAPYTGVSPVTWAHTTARLQAEAERSLADEAAGPLAQLLAIPTDGGDGGDDDPLAAMKADVAAARGKALLVETTAAGWGEGTSAAPRRDWQASRLGPSPPDGLAKVADSAFARVLAACGASPALWDDSDGTAKREALRQWFLGTVRPLAVLVGEELTAKLDAPVRLAFDLYNVDLAGRAQAFQKLVAGGVPVQDALVTAGLLADGA